MLKMQFTQLSSFQGTHFFYQTIPNFFCSGYFLLFSEMSGLLKNQLIYAETSFKHYIDYPHRKFISTSPLTIIPGCYQLFPSMCLLRS